MEAYFRNFVCSTAEGVMVEELYATNSGPDVTVHGVAISDARYLGGYGAGFGGRVAPDVVRDAARANRVDMLVGVEGAHAGVPAEVSNFVYSCAS